VQDLQDRAEPRLGMPSSRKGRGQKQVVRRPIPIPESLAVGLRHAGKGKAPNAPLLTKPSGDSWRKSDHSRLFARAAQRAGLDPTQVTIYSLRHSSIARQLIANVPIRIVATHHDTSVAMIEKTYSKYISDHTDALTRASLPATPPAGNVVVPLRG
jgi:hypothetical protein